MAAPISCHPRAASPRKLRNRPASCEPGPVRDAARRSASSDGSWSCAARSRGRRSRRPRDRAGGGGQAVDHQRPRRLGGGHLLCHRCALAAQRAADGDEVFAFQPRRCRGGGGALAATPRSERCAAQQQQRSVAADPPGPARAAHSALAGSLRGSPTRWRACRSRTPAARSVGSTAASLWRRRPALRGSPARAVHRPSCRRRPGPILG